MSITIAPKADSGNLSVGDTNDWRPEYVIMGTDSEDAAVTALFAYLPKAVLTSDGHVLSLRTCQVRYNAPGSWIGEGSYVSPETKPKEPVKAGESQFTFSTSGGTQHITNARQSVLSLKIGGGVAPNHKGAIGVMPSGIEGVDITVPVYSFSITRALDPAVVTNAYIGLLHALTSTVNNAAFKGMAAGECLFLGADGSQRGDGYFEIGYKFAGSPNKSGLWFPDAPAWDVTATYGIGEIVRVATSRYISKQAGNNQPPGGATEAWELLDTCTGPFSKRGWDYLWIEYEDNVDEAAHSLVRVPKAVNISRVYADGDFSLLGLGV